MTVVAVTAAMTPYLPADAGRDDAVVGREAARLMPAVPTEAADAVPLLVAALASPAGEVRRAAYDELSRRGPRVVPALEAARPATPGARAAVASLIGTLERRRAAEVRGRWAETLAVSVSFSRGDRLGRLRVAVGAKETDDVVSLRIGWRDSDFRLESAGDGPAVGPLSPGAKRRAAFGPDGTTLTVPFEPAARTDPPTAAAGRFRVTAGFAPTPFRFTVPDDVGRVVRHGAVSARLASVRRAGRSRLARIEVAAEGTGEGTGDAPPVTFESPDGYLPPRPAWLPVDGDRSACGPVTSVGLGVGRFDVTVAIPTGGPGRLELELPTLFAVVEKAFRRPIDIEDVE